MRKKTKKILSWVLASALTVVSLGTQSISSLADEALVNVNQIDASKLTCIENEMPDTFVQAVSNQEAITSVTSAFEEDDVINVTIEGNSSKMVGYTSTDATQKGKGDKKWFAVDLQVLANLTDENTTIEYGENSSSMTEIKTLDTLETELGKGDSTSTHLVLWLDAEDSSLQSGDFTRYIKVTKNSESTPGGEATAVPTSEAAATDAPTAAPTSEAADTDAPTSTPASDVGSPAGINLRTVAVDEKTATLKFKFKDIVDEPEATEIPTSGATEVPGTDPTEVPGSDPTEAPGTDPTEAPGSDPTQAPGSDPTEAPGTDPTQAPGTDPTQVPGTDPTQVPGTDPTQVPGTDPTQAPGTDPTQAPGTDPTQAPGTDPTQAPGTDPTQAPGTDPTQAPGTDPTQAPGTDPTQAPGTDPTQAPGTDPTQAPGTDPTQAPGTDPTQAPGTDPTQAPGTDPTQAPGTDPTQAPTKAPTTPTATPKAIKKGDSITSKGIKYTVTKAASGSGNGTITIKTVSKKASKISIPATVTIDGKTYKVTAIAKNAFKGAKVKTVTIGKNVTTIAAGAFTNCKNLKTITIKGKLKTVKKGAFKGCKKTIKVKGGSAKVRKANIKKLKKSGYKKFK